MLNIDIDQFTLMLIPKRKFEFDEWREEIASEIISDFVRRTKIVEVLGNINISDQSLPVGYNVGFNVNNALYYFSLAYNDFMPNMFVIVYFSGNAWSTYVENFESLYNKPMNLRRFFNMINSDLFDYRLSRIDTCVDFINENISIAQLKKSIEQGRTEVRYGRYK
ncbi:hypothetical protein [Anaerococcus provencensis]|uniref:hypothetical protein n=1 Tax=Anaerococcus provencensis TaxID=938293 RepID=UPI0003156E0A|nr:hypothetical protein [Anaerococcus provencensis]